MKTKKTNLLRLASQYISEAEMNDVYGGIRTAVAVACSSANCSHEVHTSVNNTLDVMRNNNPVAALR